MLLQLQPGGHIPDGDRGHFLRLQGWSTVTLNHFFLQLFNELQGVSTCNGRSKAHTARLPDKANDLTPLTAAALFGHASASTCGESLHDGWLKSLIKQGYMFTPPQTRHCFQDQSCAF